MEGLPFPSHTHAMCEMKNNLENPLLFVTRAHNIAHIQKTTRRQINILSEKTVRCCVTEKGDKERKKKEEKKKEEPHYALAFTCPRFLPFIQLTRIRNTPNAYCEGGREDVKGESKGRLVTFSNNIQTLRNTPNFFLTLKTNQGAIRKRAHPQI